MPGFLGKSWLRLSACLGTAALRPRGECFALAKTLLCVALIWLWILTGTTDLTLQKITAEIQIIPREVQQSMCRALRQRMWNASQSLRLSVETVNNGIGEGWWVLPAHWDELGELWELPTSSNPPQTLRAAARALLGVGRDHCRHSPPLQEPEQRNFIFAKETIDTNVRWLFFFFF